MLTLYGEKDCFPNQGSTDWLYDRIIVIVNNRDESFLNTSTSGFKTAARNIDGDPTKNPNRSTGTWDHCHHIPWNRIVGSIKKNILDNAMTRFDILKWLVQPQLANSWQAALPAGYLSSGLGLTPPAALVAMGSPLDCRRNWDLWITWAIWAAGMYVDNLFYGPGTGDDKGRKIDDPKGQNKVAQYARMQRGKEKLKAFIPGLDLTPGSVDYTEKVFDLSNAYKNWTPQLQQMSVSYIIDPTTTTQLNNNDTDEMML